MLRRFRLFCVLMIPGLPLWHQAALALPAWGFDFLTPLVALLGLCVGVGGLVSGGRLFFVIPAFLLSGICAFWGANLAPATLPCDQTTAECISATIQANGEKSRQYAGLVAITLLPAVGGCLLAWRRHPRRQTLLLLAGLALQLPYLRVATGFGPPPPPPPPAPPPPPPPPAPRGPHVDGTIEEAAPTTSGFAWIQRGQSRTVHRWSPEVGATTLGEAPSIRNWAVDGERILWVADDEHFCGREVYADNPVRRIWTSGTGDCLEDVIADHPSGAVIRQGATAIWFVDDAETNIQAPAAGHHLLWADAGSLWTYNSGDLSDDTRGLWRLDRRSGAWERVARPSYARPRVQAGRISWWERVGNASNPYAPPDRLCSRALDGSDLQIHRTAARATGEAPRLDGTTVVETDRGFLLQDTDGKTVGRFVLPNPSSPWYYQEVPTGIFWWTPTGLGIEPLVR